MFKYTRSQCEYLRFCEDYLGICYVGDYVDMRFQNKYKDYVETIITWLDK